MGLPVSRSHLVIDKMNCAWLGRWKKIENAWMWGDERCKYSANEELPHTRRPQHLIRLSAFLWHFSQFQILQQRQRQKRVMERKNIHICKSLGYSLSVKNIRTSFGHRKKYQKPDENVRVEIWRLTNFLFYYYFAFSRKSKSITSSRRYTDTVSEHTLLALSHSPFFGKKHDTGRSSLL